MMVYPLAPILSRVYQFSLDNEKVPSQWRDALIVPLFKNKIERKDKNNSHLITSHSISNLSCLQSA